MGILNDPGGLIKVRCVIRAAETARNSQNRSVFRFVMVKEVLDFPAVAVSSQWHAAARDCIERTTLNLASHFADHQAREEECRNTDNRVAYTSAEPVIVAVLRVKVNRTAWHVNYRLGSSCCDFVVPFVYLLFVVGCAHLCLYSQTTRFGRISRC